MSRKIGARSPKQAYTLIAGISLMCFGEGISFAVLTRFTLMESKVSKRTVAAAIGMINMFTYVAAIEIFSSLYLHVGIPSFAILSLIAALIYLALSPGVVGRAIQARATGEIAT